MHIIDLSTVHAIGAVERTKRDFVFGIVTRPRTFYMQASSKQEMESWILAIKKQLRILFDANTLPKSSNIERSSPVTIPATSMSRVMGSFNTTSPLAIMSINSPEISKFPLVESPVNEIRRDLSPELESTHTTESVLTIGSNPSFATENLLEMNDNQLSTPLPPVSENVREESEDFIPEISGLHNSSTAAVTVDAGPSRYVHISESIRRVSFSDPPSQRLACVSITSPDFSRRESQFSDSEEEDDKISHAHLTPDQLSHLIQAEQSLIDDHIVFQGYLYKLSRFSKSWKKRWFVLRNGKLTCYKNDSVMTMNVNESYFC